jgi:hypothetical protein
MFSCSGLLWLLIVRSHFWPFADVQNGKRCEVTQKCGDFFKRKETKVRERSIWFLRSKDSLCALLSPSVRNIISALVSKRVWCGWNTPNAIIGQTLNLVATVEEL